MHRIINKLRDARNYILVKYFLLLIFLIPQGHAGPSLEHLEGFWIYGFEQSLFETCDGRLYWMWVPSGFKGKYIQEGYRNPVNVVGYIST